MGAISTRRLKRFCRSNVGDSRISLGSPEAHQDRRHPPVRCEAPSADRSTVESARQAFKRGGDESGSCLWAERALPGVPAIPFFVVIQKGRPLFERFPNSMDGLDRARMWVGRGNRAEGIDKERSTGDCQRNSRVAASMSGDFAALGRYGCRVRWKSVLQREMSLNWRCEVR